MRQLTIMMMAASAVAPAAAQTRPKLPKQAVAASNTPYSMRGVSLGITLDEFKAIPVIADDGIEERRARCSGDPAISGTYTGDADADRAAGLITCQWVGVMVSGSMRYQPRAWAIDLGDGRGVPAFDFVTDQGRPRLYRVRFFSKSDDADAIRRGLTSRYGTPATAVRPVQNGVGNTFQAVTMKWTNTASSIAFELPCRRTDHYCLTYRHTALNKLADAALARHDAAAAEKF